MKMMTYFISSVLYGCRVWGGHGRDRLVGRGESSVFAKFGEKQSRNVLEAEAHYLIGLGSLGKGHREEARRELQKALELNINHLGAATYLAKI